MTGVTLGADPLEVDVSAVLEGAVQAELDTDLIDDGADAEADVDPEATVDAHVDLDADTVVAVDAATRLNAWADDRRLVDTSAVVEGEADVVADVGDESDLSDADVNGFLALDVCARLALLDKAGPCNDASGRPSGGDAVLDGEADLQAAAMLDAALSDDGSLGFDEADLGAASADACLRFALFGDAASCAGDPAADGGAPEGDADAVEGVAWLATAADAATSTDEGTAATAEFDACASLALFADALSCGLASAPDDGDTAPGTDDPGTSPDDGGAAPGAITRPQAAAVDGPGGSLPDTASGLIGDPFVPSAILVLLLAGSAVLRRMRGAFD